MAVNVIHVKQVIISMGIIVIVVLLLCQDVWFVLRVLIVLNVQLHLYMLELTFNVLIAMGLVSLVILSIINV